MSRNLNLTYRAWLMGGLAAAVALAATPAAFGDIFNSLPHLKKPQRPICNSYGECFGHFQVTYRPWPAHCIVNPPLPAPAKPVRETLPPPPKPVRETLPAPVLVPEPLPSKREPLPLPVPVPERELLPLPVPVPDKPPSKRELLPPPIPEPPKRELLPAPVPVPDKPPSKRELLPPPVPVPGDARTGVGGAVPGLLVEVEDDPGPQAGPQAVRRPAEVTGSPFPPR